MSAAYLREVDGLRAVAVLSVLLFHAGVAGFSGGFVGVDVFFTISGFVITRSLLSELDRGSLSFSHFYIRRVRRLFPAMLFTVAVTILVARLIMPADLLQGAAQAAMYAILSVSNIFFWLEADYFDTGAELKPFLHTWSLSVEEQFYLVWPLIVVALFYLIRVAGKAAAALVIVLMSLVSLLAAEWMLKTDMSGAFYLTPFRLFEFGLGGLCALYLDEAQSRLRGVTGELVFVAGSALILLPIFIYTHDTPFPGLTALIPTAGSALVILACNSTLSRVSLGNTVAVTIGLASYSIYLAHWPIITLYGVWKGSDFTGWEQSAIIASSLIVGYAMLRLVEAPFRVKRDGKVEHIPFMFGASAAALILVAISANTWVGSIRAAQPQTSGTSLEGLDFAETIQALCPKSDRVRLPGYSCELGADKGTYDVVVFGDSHTGHLIPGLAEFARKHGLAIRIDGSGGTFPGLNVESYRGPEHQSSKAKMIRQYYQWLSEIEPTTVVLSARWDAYYDASRPPDQASAPLVYLVEPGDETFTPENTTHNFKRSISETISYLREIGHKVVLVGQVPPLGVAPHRCFAKLGITQEGEDESSCRDFTREQALARVNPANNFLAELADQKDIIYVDSKDFFCSADKNYCRFFNDKAILYRDGNHLTNDASIAVVDGYLGPILNRSLN